MNKKLIIILLLFGFALPAFSQGDISAILSKLTKTIKSYKSLYFEYTLTIEDKQLNTSSMQDGKILAQGKKFKISTNDSFFFSDGETQWQYLKDDNEVVISSADPDSEDLLVNPIGFITGDKKEYKQRLKGEVNEDGFALTEIDFYPIDLKTPYSYIRIRIDEEKQKPYSIRYIGKDGVNYIIKIKSYTPNIEIPKEESFTFDASKYPNIEIIDLREI